ncbi:hypothetical protein [Propioniciclava sp.]|uniref:hypothetical protein n=1 Tax=Propioniciclava sp. TaxID=2038686 RepID=UPI002621D0FE|nr:hypothetical protein [Propioniciclava sp.]
MRHVLRPFPWALLGHLCLGIVLAPVLVVARMVMAVAVALARRAGDDDVLSLAATGLVGCLVSPIAWTHHWVWALPLVAWLACRGRRLLAFAWGGLLVTWVVWWSEDALVGSWTLLAVATLIALSGEPRGRPWENGGVVRNPQGET